MNVAKSPLLTPSAAAWRAMTPAARQAFLSDALAALQRQADLAPEGRPHSTLDVLMGEAEDRLAAAEAGRAEAEKRAEDQATARVAAETARAEAEARVAELQALLAAARGNR